VGGVDEAGWEVDYDDGVRRVRIRVPVDRWCRVSEPESLAHGVHAGFDGLDEREGVVARLPEPRLGDDAVAQVVEDPLQSPVVAVDEDVLRRAFLDEPPEDIAVRGRIPHRL